MNETNKNYVWDEIYKKYELESENLYFYERLLNVMNPYIRDDTSILEVGFGSGYIVSYFQDKLLFSVGLDINKEPIKTARNFFKSKNLVQGDVFNIPFKDCSFDIVWNEGMLEHWKFEKSLNALKEMKRVAKNYVIIAVPNCFSIWVLKKFLFKILGKWRFGYEESYSSRRLKKLFRLSNLEIVDVKGLQIFFGFILKIKFFAKLANKIENKYENFVKYFSYELFIIGKKNNNLFQI